MDPQLDPMNAWRRRLWICCLLVLAVVASFYRVAENRFVRIDDQAYLTENPGVQQGVSLRSLGWAFTTGQAGNWHPLTWITHQIDWQAFGGWAGGHHLVSLGLHALTSCWLLVTLHRLTTLGPLPPLGSVERNRESRRGSRGRSGRDHVLPGNDPAPSELLVRDTLWPSALVAALFAVHPLRVESVAWASERKDVLSALFWVATCWAYSRYVRRPHLRGRYHLVTFWFLLGLLSKPMLVTLPVVLLLLDVWPLGRVPLAANGLGFDRQQALFALREKLPWLAMAVVVALITIVVQDREGAVMAAGAVPWWLRLATVVVAYGGYLGLTALPLGLAFFYPLPAGPGAAWSTFWFQAIASAVVLVAISLLAWRARRTRPWLLVGWCWYLVSLLPVVGIVKVGDQLLADRYSYLPQIGLWIMVAFELDARCWVRPALRRPLTAVFLGLLAICGWLSWRQVATWYDTRTLAEHALRATRHNYVAHYLLGVAEQADDRPDRARQEFEAAVKANPRYYFALYDLGKLQLEARQFESARQLFRQVTEVRPQSPRGYIGLAAVAAGEGKLAEADRYSQQAWELAPDDAEVCLLRGEVLLGLNRPEEALPLLEKAERLDPRSGRAAGRLAELRLGQGRFAEAAADCARALELAPGDARLQALSGTIFVRRSQIAEATEAYRRALELEPALAEVANDLAWILATHPDAAFRNGVEALEWAERACQADGFQSAARLDTLAAAYAELGRFPEAITTCERAIEWARAAGDEAEALALAQRLELYRRRQPYRSP